MEISEEDHAHLQRNNEQFYATQTEIEAILTPNYIPGRYALKEGQRLRPYQAQAIEVFKKNKCLLVGDEVGLGKSYVGIGAVLDKEQLPAIVVVQTHLTKQWKDKFGEFSELKVHIIKGTKPYSLPEADVYIMKYSCLSGWVDIFRTKFFKTAVFDEIQELRRGAESGKGCAAKALAVSAEYRLGTSGTPIYNYGDEMWNIMDIMKDSCLGNKAEFLREWGNGDRVVVEPKALGAYLREKHLFLRRTRDDVGQYLQPVNTIVETVGYDELAVKSIEDLAVKLAIKASQGSFIERGMAARELDIMVRQATGISKARYVAEFVRILLENDEPVLLVGWHRACFKRGTQILMYDGTAKSVEEIVVGDLVMGPDSKPREVLVLIRGAGRMFKITPKKGQPFICSENHILTLCYNNRKKFKTVHIASSEFFKKGERRKRDYTLMRADIVQFQEVKDVFEPWLLGYWLGNGAAALKDFRVCSMDPEVEEKMSNIAEQYGLFVNEWPAPGRTGTGKAKHIKLSCGKSNGKNKVLAEFKSLNLMNNKHIPHKYKVASMTDRRRLLAGLLDSDGHVYRNGCGAEFGNTNHTLSKDVEWLCRSLGLAAYLKGPFKIVTGYGKKDGSPTLIYRVFISGDLTDIPVISRKAADKRTINKNVLRVGLRIEESTPDDFFGFEVDGDHLFLLDDFTVVHNCYDIWLRELSNHNPVMYTGSESEAQKNSARDAFINGNTNLMIMSLRSGVGLDGLQKRCSTVVFGELDWSPMVQRQVVGRLDREGQARQVMAIYLCSDSGSDPLIIDLLGLKSSQAQGILDPTLGVQSPHSDGSRIQLLVQKYLKKAGIEAPAREDLSIAS